MAKNNKIKAHSIYNISGKRNKKRCVICGKITAKWGTCFGSPKECKGGSKPHCEKCCTNYI